MVSMKDDRGAPAALDEPLTDLLAQAYRSPGAIPIQPALRRSGILALCLHCLMVKAGFRTASNSPPRRSILARLNPLSKPSSVYAPHPSWLLMNPSPEFIFQYTFPGKEGLFILHCSTQEATERMFVRVSEDGNLKNVQVMGLQVDRNVPDTAEFRKAWQSGRWAGVVRNQAPVEDMFRMYVTDPLLSNAEPCDSEASPASPAYEDNLTSKLFGLGLAVFLVLVISRRC